MTNQIIKEQEIQDEIERFRNKLEDVDFNKIDLTEFNKLNSYIHIQLKEFELKGFKQGQLSKMQDEIKFLWMLDKELEPNGILNDLKTPEWREMEKIIIDRINQLNQEIMEIKKIL
jgi:hypothetical protein